jgi:cell wall assembly regulator SMI1
MWHELIERLDAAASFHPPATQEQLQAVESRLGVVLPAELRNLLLETNGAEVAYGTGLVWPAEEIALRNLDMRWEWHHGKAEGVRNRVFLWNHEDDSRTSFATSLADWLRGRGETF